MEGLTFVEFVSLSGSACDQECQNGRANSIKSARWGTLHGGRPCRAVRCRVDTCSAARRGGI